MEKIADDIPEYLEYLPENEINKQYKWEMLNIENQKTENVEEAKKLVTSYTSRENGGNLLNEFKESEYQNISYIDVKIVFRVKNPELSNYIIVNNAQICEAITENGIEISDADSTPNEWIYGEDDQDYENIKVQNFDMSLKKYVSSVKVIEDNNEKIIETENTGDSKTDIIPKVELKRKKLNNTEVKFIYTIKVTNDGDIAGMVNTIFDYVPDGLKFYEEDNKDCVQTENIIAIKSFENVLINPGESVETTLVLRWEKIKENIGLKTNIAEIAESFNDKNAQDIDSTAGNNKKGEDDQSEAQVLISISTSFWKYIVGIGILLMILIGGVLLIKKYVI